ncbi:chemotaxis protein CheR [Hahella sp. CCB-MM4]|uniref:CheR family methyltransferase n=1 Tax=Hahella sp. (strain CCB-MM4) TaxID=1926491 RepID=UPI000B9C53E3|nr:protein-glutamate O-methyltransferase CheR [Hahella sp. CCB-MM4]OZG75286.1 chemotaxis protein CheR [Hahella sp. CCB-MM4]
MSTAMQDRDFHFTREHFEYFRRLSQDYSGIVVADNKYEMFYSRLTKRLRQLRLTSFDDYVDYLKKNKETEFTHFINALTTNLTSFFRENHHFQFLSNQVIPALMERNQRRISIWSAGCSIGEETYSIAMTLAEAAQEYNFTWEILATDIDTEVLGQARQGVYQLERVKNIPMNIKKRWFLKGKGSNEGYAKVSSELKKNIRFEQLNLIRDFGFKKTFDVIFCRNVVIYFDRNTKTDLVRKFAGCLSNDGYLILGHSESLHGISEQFRSIGNTIYARV